MKTLTKSILLVAALGLSACTNPDRFADSGSAGGVGAGAGTGFDSGAAGGVNDPRSVAYFQQTVGDRVLFAVDQSTLGDTARGTLEGQAQWLLTNTDYSVIIEGHADEQGTREYNLALGARRANAVEEYLVSRGVSPARVRVVSYGKERPIEICSDETCYAKNRRAVTVVTAGLSS
ncbi:peptidoglycan-associated lipoprotein Pal [Actibacterium lipolyticum]|uniref:Peptidoglycan-associated lipoprotein n=1 Tax=Actibacterium lipolyticum TaxID=1524263 RepID=A0A238KMH5_9RHOB|nr:peptidoglycan-associated lipoprotein Pal [Actibacterium lipolyticum]SMX44069.1 Outer membrane lipoprotein Omp16 precursor [Actibacterium lipolyticum]